MLDRWIPTQEVVTATLPLAEFEHGLKLMETGENGSIKAILRSGQKELGLRRLRQPIRSCSRLPI
jgi:hypothetical protein